MIVDVSAGRYFCIEVTKCELVQFLRYMVCYENE